MSKFKNWIGDVEVFPDYFGVTFIELNSPDDVINEYIKADIENDHVKKQEALSKLNYRLFELYDGINNLAELIRFLRGEVAFMIGFNIEGYDRLILNFIEINIMEVNNPNLLKEIYKTSVYIIQSQDTMTPFTKTLKQYGQRYVTIDLMLIPFPFDFRKGLKQCLINIKWYRIEDLPKNPHSLVKRDELDAIRDYNFNDCLGTRALYFVIRKDVILRLNINKEYNFSGWNSVLNKDNSSMADVFLSKYYSQFSNRPYYEYKNLRTYRTTIDLGSVISKRIKFTSDNLKDLLKTLKTTTIAGTKGTLDLTLKINYTTYKIKTGGLHSKDDPIILNNSKYLLIDVDASSFYPRIVETEYVCPAHLDKNAFLSVASFITKDRLNAKALAKVVTDPALKLSYETRADSLKITINSGLFGKMGSMNHWLYDEKALLTVTMNGQLLLLMLIEKLEQNNIIVISANTDGALCLVREEQYSLFKEIYEEWEQILDFKLEEARFSNYIRLDVNNYLAVYEDGTHKEKGRFLTDISLTKGYSAPVIAMTLKAFFLRGLSIEEFIMNHDNIYDFMYSQQVGRAFDTVNYEMVDNIAVRYKLARSNRYYVSVNGVYLFKEDLDRRTGILAKKKVTILNKMIPYTSMKDFGINYGYYINEISKICNNIIKKAKAWDLILKI